MIDYLICPFCKKLLESSREFYYHCYDCNFVLNLINKDFQPISFKIWGGNRSDFYSIRCHYIKKYSDIYYFCSNSMYYASDFKLDYLIIDPWKQNLSKDQIINRIRTLQTFQ